ncbi:MAG TPA: hypothetical protein VLF79_00090 [Candidatus Saccharimonadales bacterium]|nr:hypothetical protein [Candidatus Saccharimonadales bacterium]
MKKFIRILSASIVGLGLAVGTAAADPVTCGSISNTGPDSTNKVVCVDKNNTNVKCENNIVVKNDNDQNADSGDAFTVQNTSGGDVTTGNAENSNATVVALNASCAPAVTSSAVTTPTPAAPAAPGKGAAAPVAAPATTSVASLPETGSNDVLTNSVIAVTTVGAALALSQLAVSAYRRLALK